MPKVTEKHKEEIRKRLIRAAFECLREKGYERTTTREILARSGLSAGAFYHYFASKDELIGAAGAAIAEEEVAFIVTRRLSGSVPPGVTVAEIAAQLFGSPKAFLSELPAARAQAAHVPAIRDALMKYDERLIGAASDLSRRAQSEGDLRKDIDVEALNELALTVYEGFQARGHARTWVTSYERVAKAFLQLLAAGAAEHGSRYRGVLEAEISKH